MITTVGGTSSTRILSIIRGGCGRSPDRATVARSGDRPQRAIPRRIEKIPPPDLRACVWPDSPGSRICSLARPEGQWKMHHRGYGGGNPEDRGNVISEQSLPDRLQILAGVHPLTRTRPLRLQAGTKKATTLLTEFLHKKQGFRGLGPILTSQQAQPVFQIGRHLRQRSPFHKVHTIIGLASPVTIVELL